jgi:hypothetical protein
MNEQPNRPTANDTNDEQPDDRQPPPGALAPSSTLATWTPWYGFSIGRSRSNGHSPAGGVIQRYA